MVRLGKTYSNLMVDVAPTNAKLRGRVLVILEEATGASTEDCAEALGNADSDVRTALVSLLTGADPATSAAALVKASHRIREAIAVLGDPPATTP